MVRETSIEALRKIIANGLLSKRRLEVYEVVYHNGPMTSAEAFRIITGDRPIKNITQSRARFTELRDWGVFKEVGKKVCDVSGHTAISWDVTSGLPEKPRRLTRSEKRKEILRLMANVGKFVEMEKEYLDDYREAYRLVQTL